MSTMAKKRNHIGDLLGSLSTKAEGGTEDKKGNEEAIIQRIANPAVALATNDSMTRATSNRVPVLQLAHDQVVLFKYHDRHESSLDTAKVSQIRKSIDKEGQHFPGIVRKTNKATSDGRLIYELIVGRVRFEASRNVGFFKAFLYEVNDAEATKLMLSENEDRQDITPFERWLSVIPIIDDNVLEHSEIARMIGWDKGNLSRALKARKVYEECNLSQHLLNVSKVKLSTLTEVNKYYEDSPDEVKKAISFIENSYSNRKDNVFLKSIIKRLKDSQTPVVDTVYLEGSKLKIKKTGDSVTLSFNGLPKESDFLAIVERLKQLKAIN